jgi:hypothetical protein
MSVAPVGAGLLMHSWRNDMPGTKDQKSPPKKSEPSGWSKAEDELKKSPGDKNEGEGNKTAAMAYDRSQTAFAKSGNVAGKAKEAESALEGPERGELEKAEKAGKSRSHGEDPALFRKASGAKDGTKKRD